MKSYREEFCSWCYNLGQNRRKIKTPSPPTPQITGWNREKGRSGLLAASSSIRGDGITYCMIRYKIVAIYDYILWF